MATTFLIEFTGQYAGTVVPQITVSSTLLTGSVATPVVGVSSVVTPGTAYGTPTTLSGIQVYDKAGVRLGAIRTYKVTQTPSRAIGFRGSLGFTVPRVLLDPSTGTLYPNPDLTLIPDAATETGDRLVTIADSTKPDKPWGGVITHIEYTDGSVIVQCADVMDLLGAAQLPSDDSLLATEAMVVPPQTLASRLVPLVVSHANTWFARNGEVQWSTDATGANVFFGYEKLTGSAESALSTISSRSFGEWAWRIDVTATTMTPVLVWRDAFDEGAGPDLTDGDGGNVAAGIGAAMDPTQVVNAVRITGSVTKIESKIPAGATALPYTEIIPVAEVWWDTEGYRRRLNSTSAGYLWEVEVPWTIETDAIASEEEARRRRQFMDFIHGFHAQFGRPWHDGWAWNAGQGSDDSAPDNDMAIDDERYLTYDTKVHFRQMGVLGWNNEDRPVSIVMRQKGYLGQNQTYRQYTVKYGDTLQSISKQLYGTNAMWDELYELNRGRIKAANLAHDVNPYNDRRYTLWKGTVLDYPADGGTKFTGKAVCVWYDRVNAVQYVFPRRRARVVPVTTVFDFEWRRYRMGEYDPQTDGIGQDSPFRTVKGGVLKTRSWRVVPANSGGSGSTSLLYGITSTVTKVPVVSVFPLPTRFPFVVTVGTDEKMLVRSIRLNVLTVTRGYLNTPASIHESGEPVEYEVLEDDTPDDPVEETTPPPEQIPWPEGEAYARKLLEKYHVPRRRWSIHVANVGGVWSDVDIGTTHAVDIQSEGPAGGLVGTVRVLGYSADLETGEMELIVEDVI